MSQNDFLDDEQRKRLAYADRAETLERDSCGDVTCCPPPLADGTGRHSRDQLQLHDALTRIDALTAELARREDRDARNDVVLDVLDALVRALPQRLEFEFSPDSRRVLNALADARATLAEAGR